MFKKKKNIFQSHFWYLKRTQVIYFHELKSGKYLAHIAKRGDIFYKISMRITDLARSDDIRTVL